MGAHAQSRTNFRDGGGRVGLVTYRIVELSTKSLWGYGLNRRESPINRGGELSPSVVA